MIRQSLHSNIKNKIQDNSDLNSSSASILPEISAEPGELAESAEPTDAAIAKLADLVRKIEIERKCRDGARQMATQLTDPTLLDTCRLTLLESQRRLDYLESQQKKLCAAYPALSSYITNTTNDPPLPTSPQAIHSPPLPPSPSSKPFAMLPQPIHRTPPPRSISFSDRSTAEPRISFSDSNPNSPAAENVNTLEHRPSMYTSDMIEMGFKDSSDLAHITQSRFSFAISRPASFFFNSGHNNSSGGSGSSHSQNHTHATGQSMSSNVGMGSHNSMFDRMLGALKRRSFSGSGSGSGTISNSTSLESLLEFDFEGGDKESRYVFDYLKSETSLTPEKVKYKLNEIKCKMEIEQKVKTGTERMCQVLNESTEVNPTRQKQAEEKLAECHSKLSILQKSIQRYQSIAVDYEKETAVTLKKVSMNGKLKIKLIGAAGIPNKKSHRSEQYAIIKIDGVDKAQSKPQQVKWMEDFDISVDRAQEVEICIYEKSGGLLAFIWFKLADVADMIMKRNKLNGGLEDNTASSVTEHCETWLDLEPGGQIAVKLHFVEEVATKKIHDGTLARRRPVQKVFPKYGHKFISKQFYQVMKCAVCNEFLISGQGYNCQGCNFTCHRKCQPKVISNCIATSANERDNTHKDHLLNHNIPHRFDVNTSIAANWCCHCGAMVPLTKKQSLRCLECGVSAHHECAPLVPNFCGLNPTLINLMRSAIDEAERLKRGKEKKIAVSKVHVQPQVYVGAGADGAKVEDVGLILKHDEKDVVVASTAGQLQAEGQDGWMRAKSAKISLDDFNFLAVLGKGNFGKVMLAEDKVTKKLHAVKVLKKEFILENDEVESMKSEKRCFLSANKERFPFLVNLHSCFQTESRVYFVMEYVSGGDLMWHIQKKLFSLEQARFYACEVLLALEYFHKHNIVYRDLKLDNILLSVEGHVKIADYGLCKENMHYGATTTTFCGTPEFMAPEILAGQPYGRPIDWWALGVLIYEMLLGSAPFQGRDEDEIFDAILHRQPKLPSHLNKDASHLLTRLLSKNPNERLGSSKADADEIKTHPFFKNVDWKAMVELKVPPPYFPSVGSPTDISNFDSEFTKEKPVLTPCTTILSAADQEEFRGFTYIR